MLKIDRMSGLKRASFSDVLSFSSVRKVAETFSLALMLVVFNGDYRACAEQGVKVESFLQSHDKSKRNERLKAFFKKETEAFSFKLDEWENTYRKSTMEKLRDGLEEEDYKRMLFWWRESYKQALAQQIMINRKKVYVADKTIKEAIKESFKTLLKNAMDRGIIEKLPLEYLLMLLEKED